ALPSYATRLRQISSAPSTLMPTGVETPLYKQHARLNHLGIEMQSFAKSLTGQDRPVGRRCSPEQLQPDMARLIDGTSTRGATARRRLSRNAACDGGGIAVLQGQGPRGVTISIISTVSWEINGSSTNARPVSQLIPPELTSPATLATAILGCSPIRSTK